MTQRSGGQSPKGRRSPCSTHHDHRVSRLSVSAPRCTAARSLEEPLCRYLLRSIKKSWRRLVCAEEIVPCLFHKEKLYETNHREEEMMTGRSCAMKMWRSLVLAPCLLPALDAPRAVVDVAQSRGTACCCTQKLSDESIRKQQTAKDNMPPTLETRCTEDSQASRLLDKPKKGHIAGAGLTETSRALGARCC